MFIIIAGGGRIGYHLLKNQMKKMNEVVVIEKNKGRCYCIVEELGSLAVLGDACDPNILEKAGINRAEMIIACTGRDEDNLVICQLARKKFRVPFTIALVNNPANEEVFKKLGVDAVINTINAVLNRIELKISHQGSMTVLTRENGIEFIETKLTPESTSVGKPLGQLGIPPGCAVSGIIRNGELIKPQDEVFMKAGDVIISLSPESLFTSLKKALLGRDVSFHAP